MDTTWVLPERIPGHPQEDSGPWKTVPDTTAEAGRITEFRVASLALWVDSSQRVLEALVARWIASTDLRAFGKSCQNQM